MAGGGGKRGGDRVLESRHLVGLFLGVVLLCGVFFTLGYVMGRNQYDGAVHAESTRDSGDAPVRPSVKSKSAEAAPAAAANPSNNEWDFYTKKDDNHLEAEAKLSKPATPSSSVTTTAPSGAASAKPVLTSDNFAPPHMLKGSIVLQIAAVTHRGDALAMADALQQKRFPCFVVAPATDGFYRVQVGPYRDERSAEAARSALERDGFKAIIKR
jgi:cell division septation protein DedD